MTRVLDARKCLSRNEVLDLVRVQVVVLEGTWQVKRNAWSAGLSVSGGGVGVVAHAGSVATRLLAGQTGLKSQLSAAMSRRGFTPVHDRGRGLVDVAVMLADGGEAISDIEVLRHQSGVLGPVASPPAVWRVLDEVTAGRLRKIAAARALTRRHVWAHLPGGVPARRVAGTDLGSTVVLDVAATVVSAVNVVFWRHPSSGVDACFEGCSTGPAPMPNRLSMSAPHLHPCVDE